MKEKRRSQRVNYLGTGWLTHKETPYFFRLENISMHGARVVFLEPPPGSIQHGEKCFLKLHHYAEGQQYLDIMVQIICLESAVASLEFLEVEGALKDILENRIRKELHLFDGAHKIINLARETAVIRGIDLTDVHFDNGELIPEREIHALRFFTGKHTSNVHLHRSAIEKYYVHDGAVPVRERIFKAIDRLYR